MKKYFGKNIYKKLNKYIKAKKEIIYLLKNNKIKLYVQPKYDTNTKKVCGGEVLVRLHEKNNIIFPNEFINKLEKNKLIYLLDLYVLNFICKKLEKWNKNEYKKIKISINQSQNNLLNYYYIDLIKKIVSKYNFEKNLLEIELTEGIFIEDKKKVKKLEEELHKLNLQVSIDDFGTGYSSYYLLSEINIDILKLDKKLFENLKNKKARIIVEAIIDLTKRLKLKTVAEGIETKEEYEFVKKTKCDEIQGFYFSKAIPIEIFEEMIK